MTRRSTLLLCLTLLLVPLALGSVACGSLGNSAFDNSSLPTPTEVGSDAGGGGALGPTAKDGPTDNALILVHAAKTPSFRLCFRNDVERLPLPDKEAMPQANVVGVDQGSAVRLPPLSGAPGDVYLFDEPLIRAFYPQFGGSGEGPKCADLLSASNSLSKIAVKLGTIDKDLSTGVHLLVVRGCIGNGALATYSKAQCGDDWDPVEGNRSVTEIELRGTDRAVGGPLPAQVVNLSKQLDNARRGADLVVSFGDLTDPKAKLLPVAINPPLFGGAYPSTPTPLDVPTTDPATFASHGIRLSMSASSDAGADSGTDRVVLDTTLADIQSQSSPSELPPSYYGTASNYAFLLLGDPAATLSDGGPDTDERRNVHLLAVPVISPKADAGGGGADDGGSTVDGGAANP